MRLNHGALLIAWIALAAAWPPASAPGQQDGPFQPKPDAAPGAAASANARLTLTDVKKLRDRRISPGQIADSVAERGRAFEVTEDVARELRRLGFRPAQIDAIKESSAEPLVPGKSLATSDEEREQTLKEMKQVAVRSKAGIEPIESQHVTLWASKENQQTYLPDVQKLEKFFHTKCAEPIRSGLDKRSTHVVLLRDHAEYEAWCRAMFGLFGEQFDEKDNPGANEEFRSRIIKRSIFNGWQFCAISLAEQRFDGARRNIAFNLGGMYFAQLSAPGDSTPLQTGFADGAEAVVTGSPSVMYSDIVYHGEDRNLAQTRGRGPCWFNGAWRSAKRRR